MCLNIQPGSKVGCAISATQRNASTMYVSVCRLMFDYDIPSTNPQKWASLRQDRPEFVSKKFNRAVILHICHTIATPTDMINPEATNHPYHLSISLCWTRVLCGRRPTQAIPTGPAGIDNESVDAIEGSTAIILKAIPKTSKVEKFRFNSCLYPSCAKCN
jgi:hypothetical protein